MTTENQNTQSKPATQALAAPPGSRLDYTVLPGFLKGMLNRSCHPLSLEQEMMILGSMAVMQNNIEEDGLAKTIEIFREREGWEQRLGADSENA